MLKKFSSSFIFIVGVINLAASQTVRPLPSPIINIQCGQLSIIRHTGLVSPPLNQQVPTVCTYRVNAISNMICQMRLDFVQFSLAGPTVSPYPTCLNDYLKVGNITLCGQNAGQHIYIPINPRQGERQLQITINTADRSFNNQLARPSWNIAIHQLECPFGQSRSAQIPAVAAQSSDANTENVGIFRQPRTIVSDWLAPAGCLQYFVQPTGVIESFNLANGAGPYPGNMNYAICFRRLRPNTAIKFIPVIFRMGFAITDANNPGYDSACFGDIQSIGRSEDYIFIPNAQTDEVPPARASRFCAQSVLSRIITSSPPGPFMIQFNSDQVYEGPTKEEIGFRMQYEIV